MTAIKRTATYFLILVLLCGAVFSMPVHGGAGNVNSRFEFTVNNINVDSLISYLEQSLMECPKRVDVSDFGIPYTNSDGIALQKLVWHGTPLLFHVNGIGLSGNNGIIQYLYFTYHYDADTYKQMYRECTEAALAMVGDLINNKSLDDVMKALIIHDRIIVSCEYDLEGVNSGNISNESQEMYGVLVDGVATCQGYSYAYMYLLDLVGIDSYVCTSEDMGHDWNIVILNGKKYHVDVTFDDPVIDVTGRVYHDYFLLSTKALKKAEHNYNDFDSSPTDTTYDNHYWRNSRAEFVLIGSNVYYIDNINEYLYRLGNSSPIADICDIWITSEGNYWIGNYCRLATDGVNLLYSKSDGIYLYDLSTKGSKRIYSPEFRGEASGVYGFTYDDGYLIIDRFNRPDFEPDTNAKYQLRISYDKEPPTARLSYTNSVSAYQTVSISMSDLNGIAGYYWGRDSLCTNNRYTATHSTEVCEYISEAGTYYLTVKDVAGNLSDTQTLTFRSTRLETDGANVETSVVITANGESFTLPIPSRSGYEFIGWSRSYTDTGDYIVSYTPQDNGVLYALWRYTGKEETIPLKPVNNFTDVPDTAWYADAVAYCAGKGYVNGVSPTIFAPAANLTREQFVLILANVAGVNTDSYKYVDSYMRDVPMGAWYSGAVAWGVSEGYVKGVATDRFGLRQPITREQLARLFYLYAEDIGINVDGRAPLTGFSDAASVSDWAYENVQWAVYSGIISGMGQSTLAPRGVATRAQTARMFMIFDKMK